MTEKFIDYDGDTAVIRISEGGGTVIVYTASPGISIELDRVEEFIELLRREAGRAPDGR